MITPFKSYQALEISEQADPDEKRGGVQVELVPQPPKIIGLNRGSLQNRALLVAVVSLCFWTNI